MIIDPISAGVGVLSAGLGIFQGIAQSKAQKQQYVNDTAFSNATAQFNQWQAGLNYQTQNLNNQYGYWRDTVNHNQQLAYTNQLRNYEFSKELAQAQRVAEARTGAGTQFIVSSEAIQQQMQERGMQEAVAMQQYQYRGLQASAAYQASAQEGATMARDRRPRSAQSTQGQSHAGDACGHGPRGCRNVTHRRLGEWPQRAAGIPGPQL